MTFKHNEKSFTLVETIAAALLLSLAVVVLAGISVRALRTARLIAVYEQAWDLADRQLTMVDYIGIGQYILSGPMEGTFEGDGVDFDWMFEITETDLDFLYDVTVTVGWIDQQRYARIQTQTRFCENE